MYNIPLALQQNNYQYLPGTWHYIFGRFTLLSLALQKNNYQYLVPSTLFFPFYSAPPRVANNFLALGATCPTVVFSCPPRAATNNYLVVTWCCLTLSRQQCELVGRLDLSVSQLVAFAKEGMIHGNGKVKAKRQELPLKSEDGGFEKLRTRYEVVHYTYYSTKRQAEFTGEIKNFGSSNQKSRLSFRGKNGNRESLRRS